MNTYLISIQEFYNMYSNYMEKYASRPQTDKNHKAMFQIAGEYYEMYQQELLKNGNNEFLVKSCGMFLEFQELVMEHKTDELKSLHTEFGDFIKDEKNKSLQQELIAGVFEIDMAQMKLQNEKISKCQELVELDTRLFGGITEMTKNVLESQHMELVDGQVKEKINEFIARNKTNEEISNPVGKFKGQVQYEKEYSIKESEVKNPHEADSMVKESGEQNRHEQKNLGRETARQPRQEIKPESNKKQYQAAAYMKKTTDKPIVLYGNDKNELIARLQKWNETRTGEDKYHSCYIRTYNQETDKYENFMKYDVATGKDVTPIYLAIPPMKREDFLNTVNRLKADGAKYNAKDKMFYIIPQQDISKFKEFIPDDVNLPHTGREKSDVGKESVRKKLEQNKGKLKESGQEKQHKEQDRTIG